MKKFVLSLAFLASICVVNAQVYLNEFYVRPQGNENEYFELYNGSNSATSLSCYTLVTYFNDGTDKGFYVIKFPAVSIPAHGFYVASSANPYINYQNGQAPADLNWNLGYTTKYVYTGSGYTATSGTASSPSSFNDIFIKSNGTGNGNNGLYGMFLFNGSNLVDALLGANNTNTVPDYITGLPALPASASNCGTISFSGLNSNPDLIANVNQSAGTDNGYYRQGNGPCPDNQNWTKSSSPSEHTPGMPNPGSSSGNTQNQVFTINATCSTPTTVSYRISGGDSKLYPLNVTLYQDVNGNGKLESTDVQIGTTQSYTTSGSEMTLSNPQGWAYLLLSVDAKGVCADTVKAVQCAAGITLPVSLKSFNAKRNGNAVSLTWETVTEISNTGFYIQRLNGNGGWETLGFVSTQATGGNSNSLLSYSYSDVNTFRGVSQYRLRQVDVNGAAKISEVRSVRSNDMATRVTLYPNPSNTGNINVVFDDAATLRDVYVSDMSGRVLKQWKGISNNNLLLENLNPGVYTVRIVDTQAGTQTTDKFVINQR